MKQKYFLSCKNNKLFCVSSDNDFAAAFFARCRYFAALFFSNPSERCGQNSADDGSCWSSSGRGC